MVNGSFSIVLSFQFQTRENKIQINDIFDHWLSLVLGMKKARPRLCHTLCLLIYEIGQFFEKPKSPIACLCRGGKRADPFV
jgi:hypothetical protein